MYHEKIQSRHRLPREMFVHNYPDAGKDAPESIQKEIEEFKQLPDEDRKKLPLLYHILGSGTPPYKMSKEDTEYENESTVEGQNCANCEFAYQKVTSKKYICSQISGGIKLEGWCNRWLAAKKITEGEPVGSEDTNNEEEVSEESIAGSMEISDPMYSYDDLLYGMKMEMGNSLNKEMAKSRAIKNLLKDPKYYSKS